MFGIRLAANKGYFSVLCSRESGDADLGKAVFSGVCRARAGLRGSRGRSYVDTTDSSGAPSPSTSGADWRREGSEGGGERRRTWPPALGAATRGPKIAPDSTLL